MKTDKPALCPQCKTGKLIFYADSITNYNVVKRGKEYVAVKPETSLWDEVRGLRCDNVKCTAETSSEIVPTSKKIEKVFKQLKIAKAEGYT